MTDLLLSEAEKMFIIHGVQDNLRVDGRSCDDYRHIELETDVVSSANGSARLKLSQTDVLVGVKADLTTPPTDNPDVGTLEFFVDCSANAAPTFEGRGGEDLARDISSTLARAYSSDRCSSSMLKALCVVPSEQCWVLYIDILILECGGSLYDAVSIAVKAALSSTKVPVVKVTSSDGGKPELELSDDPYDSLRINVKHAPCNVTLSKIGHSHVVDASLEEEVCSLASLMMAVTEEGTVTMLKKSACGSLHPESIYEMLETGKNVGLNLNKQLTRQLLDEECLHTQMGTNREPKGFL
ncbi:PREDICTED: exosome complex component RRP42-like [Priapulus caudatus]|uniref:Ribosomal RNA-processing protein 42 n=1 Tax=Priapulus caudatus TaxID=37621 RepID=A0ABM1E278_PRICU|nr:PREDICTED: exosome complex component RRP42-like [Priapulus caudatus]